MTDGRFSPRAIKGDADHDYYTLTTVGGVSMWLPGGIVGLTSADSSVTVTDNGDGTLDLAAVGGGGGGGTTVNDPRWTTPAGHTRIDGFSDGSIGAAWTRVDTSGHTGNVGWAEKNDVLSCATGLGTDAVAEFHGYVVPLSSFGGAMADGDGFVSACNTVDFPNTNYVIGGVVLTDGVSVGGVNTQLIAGNTNHPTVVDRRFITGWNTSVSATNVFSNSPQYRRIARISGTTWRIDVSDDCVTWILGATFTTSLVPTHVGFAVSSWGTATRGGFKAEFLDRVAGVT